MDPKKYFEIMVARGSSDLFLSEGLHAAVRINGLVELIEDHVMTKEEITAVFNMVVPEAKRETYFTKKDIDLSYAQEGCGRFRVNVFTQQDKMGFVFRHISTKIPTMEDLHLPTKTLQKLADQHRGLILVTGITGSGKSTTLATMIDYVNHTHQRHIITVEDPVEYVYKADKCIINQREVGIDTESFLKSLKYAMRQSPDVVLIGEMRDEETVEAAINAAETGHLVMSTLHTVNAIQTVERIINFFPPHQHALIRMQLSLILKGVLSQRLVRTSDGKGRVPCIEILVDTPTVQEIIFEGRTRDLEKALKEGDYYGTQTFNQSLKKLYTEQFITLEDAMAMSDNPDELQLEIRGISKGAKVGDMNFSY